MDKADLKKLKEQLPPRYAAMIKQRTGKSYSSIYKTFKESSDLIVEEVVDAAIQILEEQKKKDQDRQDKLSKLL